MRACALALIALVAVGGFAPAADAKKKKKKKGKNAAALTVLTRNIYLGGDITRPIAATTPEEFAQKTGELWEVIQQTDFPSRAPLLAKEIKRTKPHVIGLQEAALWRRGPDGQADGYATPATTVVYDFVKLLRRALKKAGVPYRVAVSQNEIDLEAPTSFGYDVRLTMRDVILVRKGLKRFKVRRTSGDNFDARLTLPTQVGPVDVIRGWTALDATWKGKKFRVVNTHLEAFLPDARLAQAEELVARGGPARKKGTVFIIGDLNSDPRGDPPDEDADPVPYNAITDFGFFDTWILKNKRKPGFSCCMNQENIMDPPPAPFDHRIDHILVNRKLKVIRTRIVGNDRKNRSSGGLWPSDHGGLASTVRLK